MYDYTNHRVVTVINTHTHTHQLTHTQTHTHIHTHIHTHTHTHTQYIHLYMLQKSSASENMRPGAHLTLKTNNVDPELS